MLHGSIIRMGVGYVRLLRDTKLIVKISIPIIIMITAGAFIVFYSLNALQNMERRDRYLVDYYFSRLEMFGQVREQFLEASLMNRNIIIGQPEDDIPAFREVAGDAGVFVAPGDDAGFAAAVRALDTTWTQRSDAVRASAHAGQASSSSCQTSRPPTR